MKKSESKSFVSPYPVTFHRNPEALTREISTNRQKNWSSDTIIYGEDDALPLRIAQAVQESPATGACLDTIGQFIKGSGFSDKKLMDFVIDDQGTTLWQLHCILAESLALFHGFSVNFKYSRQGTITTAYPMSFESVRFKKPVGDSKEITAVKYNPYFGTDEYQEHFTKEYPVYDIKQVKNQIQEDFKTFPGQVYYYGKVSPLYRFYPMPTYWRAKKWIYVDGKIQEFHSENLDNGFFQSVLMNVIGDPNAMSKNPKYQEEYEDEQGVKKKRPRITVGEEFGIQMQQTFSGTKKAGNVMVMWSNNADQAVKVQQFPNNTNSDLFTALQDLTTKNITIATRVPSILANISEGVSLGSAGSEIQKAVELMQSRVVEDQQRLMSFYNDVLLPNFVDAPNGEVSIVNFNPISEPVEIEDKFWEFLNDEEKAEFIKTHIPGIKLIRKKNEVVAQPTINPETGEEVPPPPAPNEALKDINQKQMDRILNIAARYSIGLVDPTNKKALTFEQAKAFLLSFGITEAEIPKWLVNPEAE